MIDGEDVLWPLGNDEFSHDPLNVNDFFHFAYGHKHGKVDN
jgi:hypothetical protein